MSRRVALRVAGLYAALGAVWILLSELLFARLARASLPIFNSHPWKAWVFIGVTAALLYVAVQWEARRREQAERARRESETRLLDLLDGTAYGVFRAAEDGALLDANAALIRMLGCDTKEELLSRRLAPHVFRPPFDDVAVREKILGVAKAERKEVPWKRADGSPITVLLSGRALTMPDGKRVFEGIVEDISERRALETRSRLLQKYEAIGHLAGGVAQDFNNLLGAILGWAQIAMEDAKHDTVLRGHLERIHAGVERGTRLAGQLLSFARQQVLMPRNVDVSAAASLALHRLRATMERPVEIEFRPAAERVAAHADPDQLEEILLSLCWFARDSMPQGGKLIVETRDVELDEEYVRRYPWARRGHYALLKISDNGPGMDRQTLERLFEPFFTTKANGQGAGLGLAAVYGMIKQHGGFINVFSEPGRGSAFHVYLPRASGDADAPLPPPEEEVRGGQETILLAEDHEATREMTQQALERLGYTVLAVADGEDAVRLFRARRGEIALVVLDVVMPRLNGPEAYQQIRALQPEVAVLFASGYSTESDMLSAVTQRRLPLIQKPYTLEKLAREVRAALEAHPDGGPAAQGAALRHLHPS